VVGTHFAAVGTHFAAVGTRFAALVARHLFVVRCSNHQKVYIGVEARADMVVGSIVREVLYKPIRFHRGAVGPGGDVDGRKGMRGRRKSRRRQ